MVFELQKDMIQTIVVEPEREGGVEVCSLIHVGAVVRIFKLFKGSRRNQPVAAGIEREMEGSAW